MEGSLAKDKPGRHPVCERVKGYWVRRAEGPIQFQIQMNFKSINSNKIETLNQSYHAKGVIEAQGTKVTRLDRTQGFGFLENVLCRLAGRRWRDLDEMIFATREECGAQLISDPRLGVCQGMGTGDV